MFLSNNVVFSDTPCAFKNQSTNSSKFSTFSKKTSSGSQTFPDFPPNNLCLRRVPVGMVMSIFRERGQKIMWSEVKIAEHSLLLPFD